MSLDKEEIEFMRDDLSTINTEQCIIDYGITHAIMIYLEKGEAGLEELLEDIKEDIKIALS